MKLGNLLYAEERRCLQQLVSIVARIFWNSIITANCTYESLNWELCSRMLYLKKQKNSLIWKNYVSTGHHIVRTRLCIYRMNGPHVLHYLDVKAWRTSASTKLENKYRCSLCRNKNERNELKQKKKIAMPEQSLLTLLSQVTTRSSKNTIRSLSYPYLSCHRRQTSESMTHLVGNIKFRLPYRTVNSKGSEHNFTSSFPGSSITTKSAQ